MEMEKFVLRAAEAARVLSISRRHLDQLSRDGKIPCRRLGEGRRKLSLYSIEVLKKWLAETNDGQ